MLDRNSDMTLGSDGSLFISDSINHRIRKVSPSGAVTTVLGIGGVLVDKAYQPGPNELFSPRGLTMAASGSLVVADTRHHRLIQVDVLGEAKVFAGKKEVGCYNGPSEEPRFHFPAALAYAKDGSLYLADGHRIRRISPDRTVTTVAGAGPGYIDGAGEVAKFYSPGALAVNDEGHIFVADTANHRIRVLEPTR